MLHSQTRPRDKDERSGSNVAAGTIGEVVCVCVCVSKARTGTAQHAKRRTGGVSREEMRDEHRDDGPVRVDELCVRARLVVRNVCACVRVCVCVCGVACVCACAVRSERTQVEPWKRLMSQKRTSTLRKKRTLRRASGCSMAQLHTCSGPTSAAPAAPEALSDPPPRPVSLDRFWRGRVSKKALPTGLVVRLLSHSQMTGQQHVCNKNSTKNPSGGGRTSWGTARRRRAVKTRQTKQRTGGVGTAS